MQARSPYQEERHSSHTTPPAETPQLPTGWLRIRRDVDNFRDLVFIQFAAIRTGWHWYFLVSSIIPLGILFFLNYVTPHTDRATALYYNMVVALTFSSLAMLSGQLASFRHSKLFDFYAGLPVSRTGIILATLAVSALFAMPGMLLMLALGTRIFAISLSPNLLAALVMLVAPLTLCGVGALIGVLAPNQQTAGVITNLAIVVVTYLSPVLVPASALPGILRFTAVVLPPTYAADALRRTLQGQANTTVFVDLGVMVLFAFGSIYLVTTRLDWRSR